MHNCNCIIAYINDMSYFRFQSAIRSYGVPDEEIFQTADLFERRNISQVTLCIYALGRTVRAEHSLKVLNTSNKS